MSYYTDMQATAEESFQDTCKLAAPAGGAWGDDPGALTYSYGAALACGLELKSANEAEDGSQAPMIDAVLRLAVGTTIDETYRVQITKRHGVALETPQVYSLVGPPRLGPSALVCDLKLVTGESAH